MSAKMIHDTERNHMRQWNQRPSMPNQKSTKQPRQLKTSHSLRETGLRRIRRCSNSRPKGRRNVIQTQLFRNWVKVHVV